MCIHQLEFIHLHIIRVSIRCGMEVYNTSEYICVRTIQRDTSHYFSYLYIYTSSVYPSGVGGFILAEYISLFLVFIHLHIIRVSIRCGMEVLFCRNTSHYFQKRYKVAGVLRSAQAQVIHPNLHPQPCILNPTTQTLKLVWRGRHWHEYQDKLIATLNH